MLLVSTILISRVADAFNSAERPKNLDALIGYICIHAHVRWLKRSSVRAIRRDVREMRHVCRNMMISAYGNPLRALLAPITDPLIVPWTVHQIGRAHV